MLTKMNITFVTDGLFFTGDSDKTGSLGGSETAVLYMARELCKRGHNVKVFCNCPRQGDFDGVLYLDKSQFAAYIRTSFEDVLIACRWPEYLTLPVESGLRVLWLHDYPTSKERLLGTAFQTDLIMVLSDFHMKLHQDLCPELNSLFWKTSNGIDPEVIPCCIQKVPNKLIYTSRAERGLHYLIGDILPKLLEQNNQIKLYFAGYDISSLIRSGDRHTKLDKIALELAKRYPNHVFNLGNLNKEELYEEIKSSQLHLFPTTFPEISCISAMEAQACGTPIITTNDFALKETVGPDSGILIEGSPEEEQYVSDFASVVLHLLGSPVDLERMSQAGPKWIREQGYLWSKIAEKWEVKFLEMMENRWNKNKPAIIKNLIRHGDLIPAWVCQHAFGAELGESIIKISECQEVEARADIRPPEDTSASRLKAKMSLYEEVIKRMEIQKIKPQHLLDACCGDVPFGLVYQKMFPKCSVTCVDKNAEACDMIHFHGMNAGLSTKVVNADFLSRFAQRKYNCIFLGEVLDAKRDYLGYIQRAMQLLDDPGYLVFTVRNGSPSGVLHPTIQYDRLHNFNLEDFNQILGEKYSATFVNEKLNDSNETYGHWVVIAEKSDFRGDVVNCTRRVMVTRPYQSVGFAMITKDEEDNISRCLKSVLPYVDDAIVVDTGSRDKTIQIVESFSARVKHIKFDNFSAARNEGIVELNTDWILWIDADEVLVNGGKIRKYLYTNCFEGYAIRQNHLTLDLHGTVDTPTRVFKNRPWYRFTGMIHEHPENTNQGCFDNIITPHILIDEVDIAHYGYQNEIRRRQKCSSRNMQLLIRDLQENPTRKLSKVLAQRDLLNITRWRLSKTSKFIQQPIIENSPEHKLISASVFLYLQYEKVREGRYNIAAWPMYQDALELLAKSELPVLGRKYPPIQVEMALRGAICGVNESFNKPERIWFIDKEAFLEYMNEKGVELVDKLGLKESKLNGFEPPKQEEIIEMLQLGLNVYTQGDQ